MLRVLVLVVLYEVICTRNRLTLYLVQLAEDKLREQWRLNCPELRELESQQMQQSAQDEWEHQIQRKQQVCVCSTVFTDTRTTFLFPKIS